VPTLLALLVGVPAGYGIAKSRAHKLGVLVLLARLTPGLSFLIRSTSCFQTLGLTGTLWPMDHHPSRHHRADRRLDHDRFLRDAAARSRGGGDDRRLHAGGRPSNRIALPPCRGGHRSVAAILSIIFSWNNFIFGVVLAGRETRTLPVAVYNVLTFEQLSWGPLAARRSSSCCRCSS